MTGSLLFDGSKILCSAHEVPVYEDCWLTVGWTDPDTYIWTLIYECGVSLSLTITREEYSSVYRYYADRWHQEIPGADLDMATIIVQAWETSHL